MNTESTVTGAFVFTDVESSTAWWERDATLMHELMAAHDNALDEACVHHHGEVIKRTGDGMLALFATCTDAVAAGIDMQRSLHVICETARRRTDQQFAFRVRIGIHCGEAVRRSGDLHGSAVHRAARVMGAGHGGQVLISSAVMDAIRDSGETEGVRFESRGTHRLKGLATPEALLQVHADGFERIERPPTSLNAVTGNLALPSKAMVGREAERTAATQAIQTGFVTTLVGPGGVGKTTLVKHIGASLKSEFPDGIWFADLTPMTTEGLVPFTVATMLGLAARPEGDLLERLRSLLTDSTMLVILDNCEHVVDEVARFVAAITPLTLSGSRIVCTSQRALRLKGVVEGVVPVAPLALPGTSDDLHIFASSPSVKVFLDRVNEVQPGFRLTPENQRAVGLVCARLDGLPLALELAAARARVLDIESIAARLDQRFELLRTRSESHRHGALSATIAWSVELLEPPQRQTFAALSVFSGSFDLNAAVSILAMPEFDVIDDLDDLVDRSLLSFTDGRYRLLSSIREYGSSLLDGLPQAQILRARHADWALALAVNSGAALVEGTFQEAQNQIGRHIDDLRSAHTFLVQHSPQQSAAMVAALSEFFLTGDYLDDALAMSAASLGVVDDPQTRVDLLGVRSVFSWTAGRTGEVVPIGIESIELCEQAGLPFPSLAGVRLAIHQAMSGQPEEAARLARLAVDAVGDDVLLAARVLGVAAVVLAINGDQDAARRLAQEGVEASERIGPIRLVSALANQLMILSKRSSMLTPVAERLMEISYSIGRLDGVGQALTAIADQLLVRDELRAAVEKFTEATELLVRTGRTATVPGILEKLLPHHSALSDEDALIVIGATGAMRDRLEEAGTAEQMSIREERTAVALAALGERGSEILRRGQSMSPVELVDYLRWLTR